MPSQRERLETALRASNLETPPLLNEDAVELPRAWLERLFSVLHPLMTEEKEWNEALKMLPALIQKTWQLSGAVQQRFLGDFAVFSQFIRAQRAPMKQEISRLDIASLWGLPEEESKARYQGWMSFLLGRVEAFQVHRYRDLKALREALETVESLSRLLPPATEIKTETASIVGLFKRWVLNALEGLQRLMHKEVALTHQNYLKTVDKLWLLLHRFGVTREEGLNHARATIVSCYEAIRDASAARPYFFNTGTTSSMASRVKGFFRKVVLEGQVSFALSELRKDLEQLTLWSLSEAKLLLLSGDDKGPLYVRAHALMEARFMRLSEAAFSLRQNYEQALRGRFYLPRLRRMDDAFIGFDEEIAQAKMAWRSSMAAHYSEDDFFKRANACFEVLEREPVQRLKAVDWVYHTAYAWETTEGVFAHEMNARNEQWPQKRFETYGLESCQTLSDRLIDEVRANAKTVLHMMPLVHPDKASDGAEAVVRADCTQRLSDCSAEARHMAQLWQKGQWRGVAPLGTLLLEDKPSEGQKRAVLESLEEVPLVEPITHIPKPTTGLSLSTLKSFRRYLAWAEREPHLHKRLHKDEIPLIHEFYSGPPEDELRRMYFEVRQAKYFEEVLQWKKEERRADIAESKVEEAQSKAEDAERLAALESAQREKVERALKEGKAAQDDALTEKLYKQLCERGFGIDEAETRRRFESVVAKISHTFKQPPGSVMSRALEIIHEQPAFEGIRPVIATLFSQAAPRPGVGESLSRLGTFAPARSVAGENDGAAAAAASSSVSPSAYLRK